MTRYIERLENIKRNFSYFNSLKKERKDLKKLFVNPKLKPKNLIDIKQSSGAGTLSRPEGRKKRIWMVF